MQAIKLFQTAQTPSLLSSPERGTSKLASVFQLTGHTNQKEWVHKREIRWLKC